MEGFTNSASSFALPPPLLPSEVDIEIQAQPPIADYNPITTNLNPNNVSSASAFAFPPPLLPSDADIEIQATPSMAHNPTTNLNPNNVSCASSFSLPPSLPSDVYIEIQATPPIADHNPITTNLNPNINLSSAFSSGAADHINLATMDISLWSANATSLVVLYYQQRPQVPPMLRFGLFTTSFHPWVY
ncbi:uncharacterized protein P19A11.02c-like [Telopea speciosissima]|uniref:uncharacterized protein P19A11.02c-like n=1 Tax=Telopea speciosissima TaxID=54955 RepID=UPI001CC3EF59|nr:uncharacterized protein P19A11.02c-like [Telopea speciosissima]